MFNCVTIVGVGLIGGSLALEIKKKKLAKKVIGCGRSLANLQIAKKRRFVDEITTNLRESVSHSDFIILCTPVQTIARQLKIIAEKAKPGTLVMDVGSTKELIVKKATQILPSSLLFIGAHPLAGTEKSGAGAALPHLFKNCLCLLTPKPRASQEALKKVKKFWMKLGAHVMILNPKQHDHLLSLTSHLPQMVAYALMTTIGEKLSVTEMQKFSGGGGRDTTRLASSPSQMWRDICLANRDHLVRGLKNFEENIGQLIRWIQKGKARELERYFERAARMRKKL